MNCNKEIYIHEKKKTKFCCRKCFAEYKRSQKDSTDPDNKRKVYHKACMFRFSLNSFPSEFDFSLIEKYGWYKAKNHGNNLNGISRDHMISVSYGFENNIPCEIISHPANCMLMQHNDNVSKHKECSITLEELNQRIIDWEMKYGKFVPLNWTKCKNKV